MVSRVCGLEAITGRLLFAPIAAFIGSVFPCLGMEGVGAQSAPPRCQPTFKSRWFSLVIYHPEPCSDPEGPSPYVANMNICVRLAMHGGRCAWRHVSLQHLGAYHWVSKSRVLFILYMSALFSGVTVVSVCGPRTRCSRREGVSTFRPRANGRIVSRHTGLGAEGEKWEAGEGLKMRKTVC